MRASLALGQGVVWISRCVKVARVVPFDVNGRRLGPGFVIRGLRGGRTEVRGIAIDDDRRLWAADAASGSLRAFTIAGAEIAEIRSRDEPESDRPGAYGDPAGVAVQGLESEEKLLLSRRGSRRHALLLLDPERGTVRSLLPHGDPAGQFEGLAGVALAGRLAYACEPRKSAVLVFRDAEFHYRIAMPSLGAADPPCEPRSVAAFLDGRIVVACDSLDGGAVFLFDAGGRCITRLASGALGGPAGSAVVGEVENPAGVAVLEGASDRTSLVLVLDRDGERVQAFSPQGWCLGSFQDFHAGEPASEAALQRATQPPSSPAVKGRPARD